MTSLERATEHWRQTGTPPGTAVSRLRSLVETTTPGIVRLVTITAMVGFAVAATAPGHTLSGWPLLWAGLIASLGTALAAAGANSINQWMERGRDALMPRTQKRPLPEDRLTPRSVLSFGIVLATVGTAILLVLPSVFPAVLAATCVLVYVFAYTPLKLITPWSTYVGTIPGALPPLIGWTAGSIDHGLSAVLDPAGLSLVAIMLVWQMPHSLALAWMYKDDYAKGGYRLLPVVTPDGTQTAWHAWFWTIVLFPVTLLPAYFLPDRLGVVYIALAALTSAFFVHAGWKFFKARDRASARRLFFVSIIQLPLLFVALVGEGLVRMAMR